MNKPEFVFRDGMSPDKSYVEWLAEVKARFRKSQIKAAVRVNSAMLEFYWSVGRDLVALKAESRWGSGVVKQFALDMREAFPNTTGFSDTNVKYMKRWYLFYYQRVAGIIQDNNGVDEKCRQLADLFPMVGKSQQPADLLEMPQQFGLVPWYHHVEIFSRCESLESAAFYIAKTIDEGWSRSMLEGQISAKLFENQGNAITNFSSTLPELQGELAQEILKDQYDMGFLGLRKEHDEKELEEALSRNITRFLLELGQGFAYVGRQMELKMPGGQTFFPDLLFYHVRLKCYVVIELKAAKFIPEFAGKINFYVSAADELLKGDDDNPSIGLIICKSKDKTIVEWSFRGIDRPLGVATYQIQEVVDRTVAELEMNSK